MRIFSVLFAIFVMIAQAVSAQSLPDYTEAYVNDFADLLPDEAEERVRAKLVEVRQERGIEFTVVTIRSVTDYGYSGAIEPFATDLFNYWGVGDASRNDGLLMLIALDDRNMRIEVGSGYGSRLNDPMAAVIDDAILPQFRVDEYAAGIEQGVDATIHEVTGVWPGEFNASRAERWWNVVTRLVESTKGWILAVFLPLLAIPAQLYRRRRRYHPRTCPVDGTKMDLTPEAWDDNLLQPGQITEERLESVDHDVWVCPKCDHRTIESYKSWFTRFGSCRSCGFRTVEGDATILTSATTSSSGMKRIDYTCLHCRDEWWVKQIIPKKSSSSSSSGGSFGGGSSSGGGASGSW